MLGIGLTANRAEAWWPAGASYALDFAEQRYMRSGRWIDAASAFSFSRASPAWFSNGAGQWSMADINVPRFTPSGLMIEPARQNVLRNSSMAGASVGTPGVLPNLWARLRTGSLNDPVVVDMGQEDGVDYVDFRISGTATGINDVGVYFDSPVAVAANESYHLSAFAKIVSGSLENMVSAHISSGRYNSGIFVSGGAVIDLRSAFVWVYRNTSDAVPISGVNQLRASFAARVPNMATVDAVVRLGRPQLEFGAGRSSSSIVTSGLPATREADNLTVSLPVGSHSLRLVYDDGSEQIMPGSWSGNALVPSSLTRAIVRRLYAVPV